MACNTCAFVELSNCNQTLVIENGLPDGDYVVFVDRQLSRYAMVGISVGGVITINLSGGFKGLFNPYGGDYFIYIEGESLFSYPEIGCVRATVINGAWEQNVISLDTITLPSEPETTDYPATVREFTLETGVVIPYAGLRDKYGPTPNIQVWVYDEDGKLINMANTVSFDGYPVNTITLDFGGLSSGIIVIS